MFQTNQGCEIIDFCSQCSYKHTDLSTIIVFAVIYSIFLSNSSGFWQIFGRVVKMPILYMFLLITAGYVLICSFLWLLLKNEILLIMCRPAFFIFIKLKAILLVEILQFFFVISITSLIIPLPLLFYVTISLYRILHFASALC